MARKIIAIIGISVWASAVGIGFLWLTDYGTRPGQAAKAPRHLPAASFHYQQKKLPTLLLFSHPQCPCTRATMAELARLITHNQGRVNIHVLFYRPLDKPREWVESDLWQLAIKLPDVAVSTVSELDLLRFGVAASGQTLLYDTEGTLVFSGGITSARGHEGDNAGRSAISTYLHGGQIPLTQTPVFGCSIIDAE